MERSQKAVELCMQLLIALEKLKIKELSADERDFLFSQVKKPIAILTRLILAYEQGKKS